MGLASKNGVAFIICSLLGYFAGTLFPIGLWAIMVSIIVAYHLFLVWLVFTANQKRGLSFSIPETILTHVACVALVVLLGLGRNLIPFFWLIRFCIPALAPFESNWLFSGDPYKKKEMKERDIPVTAPVIECTGDDYEAWLHHLAHRDPRTQKRGSSLRTEYAEFIAARASSRAEATSKNLPA